jgi:hypothetical protein
MYALPNSFRIRDVIPKYPYTYNLKMPLLVLKYLISLFFGAKLMETRTIEWFLVVGKII